MKVIDQLEIIKKYVNNDSCKKQCCSESELNICYNCWMLKLIHRRLKPLIETIEDCELRNTREFDYSQYEHWDNKNE